MCTLEPLSPRELEVVECVASGLTNSAIGHRLNISDRTVQAHVAAAMRKTATRSRTALAVMAVVHELIEVDDRGAECSCTKRPVNGRQTTVGRVSDGPAA